MVSSMRWVAVAWLVAACGSTTRLSDTVFIRGQQIYELEADGAVVKLGHLRDAAPPVRSAREDGEAGRSTRRWVVEPAGGEFEAVRFVGRVLDGAMFFRVELVGAEAWVEARCGEPVDPWTRVGRVDFLGADDLVVYSERFSCRKLDRVEHEGGPTYRVVGRSKFGEIRWRAVERVAFHPED